jgi:hypothetical protein
MRLEGPKKFNITVTGHDTYAVVNEVGGTTFTAPATQRGPKLYVFADHETLIYVGQTVQGMAARMRLGFKADGTAGYYGYRWRHSVHLVGCFVWWLHGVTAAEELLTLESIESEVVFAYRRKFDQWPLFQTEIHFHHSTAEHRRLAESILAAFPGETTADCQLT